MRAVQATVKDFIDSFASEEAKGELAPKWEHECRILLNAGADVIVPAGGLPMMLFGAERGANIDGAPIVNGITLIAKTAELAIRLREHPRSGDGHAHLQPPALVRGERGRGSDRARTDDGSGKGGASHGTGLRNHSADRPPLLRP